MSYFRELPNLQYQSFLSDRKSVDDYVLVKNLFRRVKLRDDLQNVFTVFDKYQIPDGSRPDLVAEELYGSAQYDWIVLITAGITRIRDQWPLSDKQVYDYAEELYGENLNAVHHYETIEIRDSQNKLILPAGKVVDPNFRISYYDDGTLYTNENTLGLKIVNIPNPIIGISNYEYEVRKNNEKRTIYVLKPLYLQQVLNDTRKAMIYDNSSQYVDDRLIKTENTRSLIP
jgi:hypothetical protein